MWQLETAVMFLKVASPVMELEASLPPVMTASQRPERMSMAALAIDWVPAAQAVTVFSHGPEKP